MVFVGDPLQRSSGDCEDLIKDKDNLPIHGGKIFFLPSPWGRPVPQGVKPCESLCLPA